MFIFNAQTLNFTHNIFTFQILFLKNFAGKVQLTLTTLMNKDNGTNQWSISSPMKNINGDVIMRMAMTWKLGKSFLCID